MKVRYQYLNRISSYILLFVLFMAVFVEGCSIEQHLSPVEEGSQVQDETKREIPEEPVIPLIREERDININKDDPTGGKSDNMNENVVEAEKNPEVSGDEKVRSDKEFYITEITDDIFARIYGKSFKEDCTLPREDLKYLHVLHKDINGVEHEGEMIVNKHIAEDVLEILKTLYENDYPIEKIKLIDEYGADDELSMEDNNSSCFNFRFVPRTKNISKHGRGLAIDINPLYNPYITTVDGKINVDPVNGGPYADREAQFDYKLEKGDLCYNLFIEHGFEWGGNWKNSKDYQHFEIPKEKINEWYPN